MKKTLQNRACTVFRLYDLKPSLKLTRIKYTCFYSRANKKYNTTQSMIIIYCLNANKELAEVCVKSPIIQHITKLLVLYFYLNVFVHTGCYSRPTTDGLGEGSYAVGCRGRGNWSVLGQRSCGQGRVVSDNSSNSQRQGRAVYNAFTLGQNKL